MSDIDDLKLRIQAIEEILKLDQKTWKELGWYCENHPIYTSYCRKCIYNSMFKIYNK